MTASKISPPVVHVRRQWSDPWVIAPQLEVDSFVQAISPAMPAARLSWNYGSIDDGAGEYVEYYPKLAELANWYVSICKPDADLTPLWHGIILAGSQRPGHVEIGATPGGGETPNAHGLEVLLGRSGVFGSFVAVETSADIINSVLPFNLFDAQSNKLIGNRSTDKIGLSTARKSYIFSDTDGEIWTAKDVVEYMLGWWSPAFIGEGSLGGLTENLDKVTAAFGTFKTVLECLNTLINRSRGHGWRIEVAGDQPQVKVYAVFGDPVSAGGPPTDTEEQSEEPPAGGAVELAGSDSIIESIDGADPRLGRVTITQSSAHQYDKILVRGKPIIILGTLEFAETDSVLKKGWSAASETAYKAGDKNARTADKFDHVYTAFKVDPENLPAGPLCRDEDGSLTTIGYPENFSLGKRLTRVIPLLTRESDTDAPREFRAPFAVGKIGSTYFLLDRIGEVVTGAPSMPLRMLDGEMGVQVMAKPNYLLANNHFSGATPEPNIPPLIDYEDILVTCAWASTETLRIETTIASGSAGDVERVLVIDVPEAECWYQLANTVTDVQAGALVRPAAAAELRNDRDKLAIVAALAKSWYTRKRAAVEMPFNALVDDYLPGQFLRRIDTADGGIDVNSLITRVAVNCLRGRTTIYTDFRELDFRAVAGFSGRGGSGIAIPAMGPPGPQPVDIQKLPVRLGGSDVRAIRMFPVKVTKTGGSAGSKTTQCTFTYTVKDLDDVELGTVMTPAKERPAKGKLVNADGYATAFYDGDDLVLFDANETLAPGPC